MRSHRADIDDAALTLCAHHSTDMLDACQRAALTDVKDLKSGD